MISVIFSVEPEGVKVSVEGGYLMRSPDHVPYGDGNMTLTQFRNAMPAPIRTAVRKAIDAEREALTEAAEAAQARADADQDAADAEALADKATKLDAFAG